MKWINKLERKIGKYAIHNLTLYIIITYVAGYALQLMDNYKGTKVLGLLSLNPQAIMHGQVWRIVTWVVSPPTTLSILTVVMLICYYQLGTILEKTWGAFRYNLYIFIGLVVTVVGAFLVNLTPTGAMYFSYAQMYGISLVSTYYVSLSIFLGFAMTFPEQKMLFMFIIPIKIKWLALVDIAYLAYIAIRNLMNGYWLALVFILCSLAGTILYFLLTRDYKKYSYKEQKRKQEFTKAMNAGAAKRAQYHAQGGASKGASGQAARHKCHICGQTELTNPNLEFRYCSKCNGNYEYCQNHLFTHEHVK